MVAPDRADRLDRAPGVGLDIGDLGGDLLGGARGLARQRLDLLGDHRESPAGFAGARRLDGGVEGEKIGLRRDGADQLDHLADAIGRRAQPFHRAVGVVGLGHGLTGDVGCAGRPASDDVLRRGVELGGGGGDRLHVGGGFLRRGRDRGGALARDDRAVVEHRWPSRPWSTDAVNSFSTTTPISLSNRVGLVFECGRSAAGSPRSPD